MAIIDSSDYHDFVIKNGKLIGEFEQMYQKSSVAPWHQDEQGNWLDIQITRNIIAQFGIYDLICDITCGLGYYLDILVKTAGSESCRGYGFDISGEACKNAGHLFPQYNFLRHDITTPWADLQLERGDANLFVLRGSLWYLFNEVRQVHKNILEYLMPDDFLLIVQNFPPLDSDFVGKNVLPNPDAIYNIFIEGFNAIKSVWLQDFKTTTNENWYILLLKKGF